MKKLFFLNTLIGKFFHWILILYLSFNIIGCSVSRPQKPPVSVARALETRIYQNNMITVLKASINTLQDLNYTIDVLNSDVGLITASRTTEGNKILLDDETSSEEPTKFQKLAFFAGVVIVIGSVLTLISYLIRNDGKDDNNDDNDKDKKSHNYNYFENDRDEKDSPKIYRYKVTVNLSEISINKTKLRVSAAGEVEQNGSIIQTGGIHEIEFFQKFFFNMDKGLFLENNNDSE